MSCNTQCAPPQQGACQACCYNNQPIVKNQVDCCNKFNQQVVANRNDIYVNQPIINNRDHYVNNINRQTIRDCNYYHINYQNLYRDNVINRNYNQVVRQQQNFCDFSCSTCQLPGTVTNINCGSSC